MRRRLGRPCLMLLMWSREMIFDHLNRYLGFECLDEAKALLIIFFGSLECLLEGDSYFSCIFNELPNF